MRSGRNEDAGVLPLGVPGLLAGASSHVSPEAKKNSESDSAKSSEREVLEHQDRVSILLDGSLDRDKN